MSHESISESERTLHDVDDGTQVESVSMTSVSTAPSCSKRTPLPKVQLALVLLIQLAEPVVGNVIYPFVNQFVQTTGVTQGDEDITGYFTGAIEASFYATEALCVLWWGRASDRYGRKPVLIIGLLGLMLSTVGFGLSDQYWSAVLARCVEGALCGNIGVAKSTIAEMTDHSNMAQAFSMLPMMWGLGGTIAPIIGGSLARPADHWPTTIGQVAFFRRYPYILPCFIAACTPLIAAILAFFFLKETHVTRCSSPDKEKLSFEVTATSTPHHIVDSQHHATPSVVTLPRSTAASNAASRTSTPTIVDPAMRGVQHSSTICSLLDRRLLIAIANYASLAFFDQCINVLIPLVYSSARSEGGLAFSSFNIGLILGVWNIINGTFNIVALPGLLRRLGVKYLFMISAVGLSFSLAMFPIVGYVARRSDPGVVSGEVWAVVVVQLFFWIIASMGYGCIFVFINEDVNDHSRGTVNGLAQTTTSLMRSCGSIVPSALLSTSLQHNLVGGNLGYILLCLLSGGGVLLTHLLPKKSTRA